MDQEERKKLKIEIIQKTEILLRAKNFEERIAGKIKAITPGSRSDFKNIIQNEINELKKSIRGLVSSTGAGAPSAATPEGVIQSAMEKTEIQKFVDGIRNRLREADNKRSRANGQARALKEKVDAFDRIQYKKTDKLKENLDAAAELASQIKISDVKFSYAEIKEDYESIIETIQSLLNRTKKVLAVKKNTLDKLELLGQKTALHAAFYDLSLDSEAISQLGLRDRNSFVRKSILDYLSYVCTESKPIVSAGNLDKKATKDLTDKFARIYTVAKERLDKEAEEIFEKNKGIIDLCVIIEGDINNILKQLEALKI